MMDPQLKLLFDNCPHSAQILNASGDTVMVNESWRRLWTSPALNVFDDPAMKSLGLIPYIERAFAGEVVVFPVKCFDPYTWGATGPRRFLRLQATPIKDEALKVTSVILFTEDLTDQHEALENRDLMARIAEVLLETLDYNLTIEHLASATIPTFADGCLVDLIEEGEIKRLVTKNVVPEVEQIMRELRAKFRITSSSPQPTSRVLRTGRPELLEHVDLNVITQHTYNEEHAKLIRSTRIHSHLAVPLILRGEIIGALNFWINTKRRPFTEKDVPTAQSIARYTSLAIENARLYRDAKDSVIQREDFISIASHELKTPITALMLQMEVIQNMFKVPANYDQEALNRICAGANRQVNRLGQLVEDMLDLTRINRRRLVTQLVNGVNLTELVQEVTGRFAEQLRMRRIELTLALNAPLLITCDPERTEQVVTNLLSNAINYGQQRPIAVHLEHRGDHVQLRVRDEGMGIEPVHHQRIFQRFERILSPTDSRGLGLGLYICSQIMQEQGGKIYVESELGKGSTFIVEFPVA